MTPPDGASVHQQVRRLRVMKAGATGLLALAAALFAVTFHVRGGATGGWGFLRAGAEAGMVGGLADWFAVTALFRRPLGLPIPHTAIIPTRKDDIGRGLEQFVSSNFLSEPAIRSRLQAANVSQRAGRWLADPSHAARVANEGAELGATALRGVREEDVRAVLERAAVDRISGMSVGPWLGRLVVPLVTDGVHHRLVDVAVGRFGTWLDLDAERIIDVIARQAPGWSPGFVDRTVARRLHAELRRVARDVAADPTHHLRRQLDEFLLALARDLQSDPDTVQRMDSLVAHVLGRVEVQVAFSQGVTEVRRLLIGVIEAPDGELRQRLSGWLMRWGDRLATDSALRTRVDARVADAVVTALDQYRGELTTVISETFDRWDGAETARRVEVAVGRDLQFIRVNGSVVGALAGLVIHALTLL